MLLSEDDEPQDIFCLLKGYVRKFYLFESGSELTLKIVSPFAYFPTSSIVGENLNPFCYETMTNCTIVKIPKEKMVNYVKNKPELMTELTRRLLIEYSEHLDRMEELVFGGAYQKVVSVLLYLADHFGEKSRKIIIVPIKFTHQDIASLAGITRETASISMKKLKDKKIIYYYNSLVTVLSVNKLKRELSSHTVNMTGFNAL